MSAITTPRKLAAILHADVAGYSRLMGTNEEATVKLLTDYRAAMMGRIHQHAGQVVDTAGDSLLAEFSSVVAATDCALELQQMLESRNAELPPDERLEFRMGIELADVLHEGDAVYGDGVNVAARIQALAHPGGVCVSDAVRRAVNKRLPVSFESLGEQAVKNIAEPIKVFRVVPQAEWSPSHIDSGTVKRKMPFVAVGAILMALAGLVAVWMLTQQDDIKPTQIAADQTAKATDTPANGPAIAADKPSIAVLPFVNMSGDQEQEYFSDGISADIIIDLSRVSNLKVIARNSSFYYKGRSTKTEDIGRDLGVRYVLTGSVRKAGERVRISAELIDSTDAHQLWADKFDRRLEDIFELQDEITQKIVSALVVELSAREKADLALKATRNVAAYDLFLRGLQQDGIGTEYELESAQAFYREAIQLDPRFGRAYGALAVTITRSMVWGFTERSPQVLNQALELAQQAVRLNSSSPQTYWALGYVYMQRQEGEPALTAAKRSIELAPNYADGYGLLALINNRLGRGQEAIHLITRGMALNPRYTWEYPYVLGFGYYNLEEYEKAAKLFLDALARNEYVGFPRVFLISSYVRLDRIGDAQWEVTQLQTNNPNMTVSHLRRQKSIWDRIAHERFLADLEKAGVAP